MYVWTMDLITYIIIHFEPYKEVPGTFLVPIVSKGVFERCAVPVWLELK
jgi:hypothetical protein